MKRQWLTLWVFLLLACPSAARAASTVWCEAELFDDRGGWTNDAQFVDQMGSPFLMAIGLDGPVPDAVTHVRIPAAGEYRLWVRCRDWVPEFSPGRFQVILGGKTVEHVFGRSKTKGWLWEDGGTYRLKGGKTELRLHDLTGHYGRCDAILLTDDRTYLPPDDHEKLAETRRTLGGIGRDVDRLDEFDTVIVGGGLAGTFAAVASARMGCRTALLQDRSVLGGNGSTEVLVNPEGDTTREPLDPGEGGIIEEVRGPVAQYSARMLDLCRKEPNLQLYSNTHAIDVEKKGSDTIDAVVAIDVNTDRELIFPGSTFIDCTGDGSIGVWAGAENRHGREPRSMYNESRAPETADDHTMGSTLRYAGKRLYEADEEQPHPVLFTAPEWARKFPECSDFNVGRHPQLELGGWQWVIEYGGMFNTCDDAEEIRDELLRIIWGMWDHAKNHCPKLASQAGNYQLTWVSHVAGKRESRRLIGDYVLTEHDVASARLFPDRVSYAGWGIDIHPPGGFYDAEPAATTTHRQKFSIPFRCLYSKDISNLMMAGRCISVSHVALGATRVMITCGLQGQAVGTAAGLCKTHEATPRVVGQSHIAELQQQLLKDGCYLIDLPNQDPRDLARTATASASSTSPPVELPVAKRSNEHSLSMARAVMFSADKPIEKIALYLVSTNSTATTATLKLRTAASLGDFSSTGDLASAKAEIPRGGAGWITFDLKDTKLKSGLYYVWLPKTPGLSWTLFDVAPPKTMRAYQASTDWHVASESYAFLLNPTADNLKHPPTTAAPPPTPQKTPAMFAAANVIDGYARAVRGVPHSWRPDPKQPLPQWVQLDFGKQAAFNTVHVSFQSEQMRAKDFRIEVADGDDWQTVAEVSGNADRRRVISFSPVETAKLRLVITNARPDMGVCEIRVYDEPTNK